MKRKNSHATFLKESITDIRQTGSVAPSSSHLARKLIAPIVPRPNLCVIELGAGTGSVTEHILNILPADAVFLVFENNQKMIDHLVKHFSDPRVRLICDDARHIEKYLKKENKHKADYIVSGLPISNMSARVRREILVAVRDNLAEDGVFTQFQYLLRNIFSIRKLFEIKDILFEWRNIPPAFVYWCMGR